METLSGLSTFLWVAKLAPGAFWPLFFPRDLQCRVLLLVPGVPGVVSSRGLLLVGAIQSNGEASDAWHDRPMHRSLGRS